MRVKIAALLVVLVAAVALLGPRAASRPHPLIRYTAGHVLVGATKAIGFNVYNPTGRKLHVVAHLAAANGDWNTTADDVTDVAPGTVGTVGWSCGSTICVGTPVIKVRTSKAILSGRFTDDLGTVVWLGAYDFRPF